MGAILQRTSATSDSVRVLASAISGSEGGKDAMRLKVAEKWVGTWREVAQKSHAIVVPSTPGNAAALVTTAMGIMNHVNQQDGKQIEEDDTQFVTAGSEMP